MTDPRTAADVIQETAWRVNWSPDLKHPEQARYDALRALSSIHAYWAAVAMETLRRIDPAAAERVAQHIDETSDIGWQNASENAWAWNDRLTRGEPIDPEGRVFPAIAGEPSDMQPVITEAVDLCWKATPYGSTADDDTAAYILPKGAVHRLVGALQCAGISASLRAIQEPEEPARD